MCLPVVVQVGGEKQRSRDTKWPKKEGGGEGENGMQ